MSSDTQGGIKMTGENAPLDAVCYEKHFLADVIVRVDFLTIPSLAKELPPTLSRAITQHFPIAEPQEAVTQELQLGPEVTAKKTEFTSWNFFGKQREKQFTVTHDALFASYKSYTSYENVRQEFISLLTAFFSKFPEVQSRRLGLRYVNQVTAGQGDPLEWSQWINPKLTAQIDFHWPSSLSRSFNVLEYSFEDFRLRFQFGIPNPDHPALIRQRQFVLDLDAYTEIPQDIKDIESQFNRFHSQIQEVFELSITESLRKAMHG